MPCLDGVGFQPGFLIILFYLLVLGYDVEGIHHQTNLVDAINKAEAIFVGGGNTFRLLKNLYEKNLIEHIQKRVLEDGIPYIGSSAGMFYSN